MKKILFSIVLVCSCVTLLSQSRTETLIMEAYDVLASNPSRTVQIIRSINENDLNKESDEIKLTYHRLYAYIIPDNPDIIKGHLIECKKLFEKTGNLRTAAYLECLHSLGNQFCLLGDTNRAIKCYKEAIDNSKKNILTGDAEYDVYYANIVFDLGILNWKRGYIELAKKNFLASFEISKNHPKLLGLFNLPLYYEIIILREEKKFKEALQYDEINVDVVSRYFSHTDDAYLQALDFKAVDEHSLGNNNAALNIWKTIINTKQANDNVTYDIAPVYEKLLDVLYEKINEFDSVGDIDSALVYYEMLIDEAGNAYGKLSKAYLGFCLMERDLLVKHHRWKDAIVAYQKIIDYHKDKEGIGSDIYWMSVGYVGYLYHEAGDIVKAIELREQEVENLRLILSDTASEYIGSLYSLANYYAEGRYTDKAIEIGEQVVSIRKKTLGENNLLYLRSLHSLASFYGDMGDFQKAIDIEIEALKAREELYGKMNEEYVNSLSGLASYYFAIGDYRKSEDLERQSLTIIDNVLGKNSKEYVSSLYNLSIALLELWELEEATKYAKLACEYCYHIYGENHPLYLRMLSNLGDCYRKNEQYDKAIELHEKVVDKMAAIKSDHHQHVIALNSLAMVYTYVNKFEDAIRVLLQSKEEMEAKNDTTSDLYYGLISNLSYIYTCIGNYSKAEKYFLASFYPKISKIQRDFAVLTENERNCLWNSNAAYLVAQVLEIAYHTQTYDILSCAYNATLLRKGVLINSEKAARANIDSMSNLTVRYKYNQLRNDIMMLDLALEHSEDYSYTFIDSLRQEVYYGNRELIKLSKDYGDIMGFFDNSWKDVQKELNDDDIAIEFTLNIRDTLSDYFYAVLLKHHYDKPKLIRLCRYSELDTIIRLNDLSDISFFNKIWRPLAEELSGVKNIYFSPYDILNYYPMEYVITDKGHLLSENYKMYRLSTTAELIGKGSKHNNSISEAVLYGGLKYDSYTEYKDSITSIDSSMSRGNLNDISYATKKEIDTVAFLLKNANCHYITYTGDNGTEESFKNLSNSNVNLIHLATHGFSIKVTDVMSKKTSDFANRVFYNTRLISGMEDNALYRNGLLMSRAESYLNNSHQDNSNENGILTGMEIARMTFPSLDLVVLSACETGLGDVSPMGDGVLGLQRAFKKAGAQSVLMTLWKIDDEATTLFMIHFYRHLCKGESKLQSLNAAQSFLRNYVVNGKCPYNHPKYWAAFVLLDGLD